MKKLLLTLALPLLALAAHAQFQYNFTYQTGQPYTPLPAASPSVNGSLAWDEEEFGLSLPFNFQWNKGVSINHMALVLGFPGIVADSNYYNLGYVSGFSAIGTTDLADKGLDSGISKSPIRTQVTGTAPNRIFKLEIRNAGFFDDFDADSVFTDSVSMQYWLYETSNVVEMRYGPSSLTPGNNYFLFNNGPTVLYVDSLDVNSANGATKGFYFLTGPANAPALDSATDIMNLGGLNDYPASGTVYRFTPKTAPTSVQHTLAADICQVYPTETTGSFRIRNNGALPLAYTVTALTGQKLLSGTAPRGVQSVDIGNLAAGMYLVQVQSADGAANFRILKK